MPEQGFFLSARIHIDRYSIGYEGDIRISDDAGDVACMAKGKGGLVPNLVGVAEEVLLIRVAKHILPHLYTIFRLPADHALAIQRLRGEK